MKRFCKLVFILVVNCGLVFAQQPAEPAGYGAIPSERQLKWHELEMYCLVHFTPTTFQNKEWGTGDAEPSLFHPAKFDPLQIAGAARSAGMNGLILVAKHHDGFALWPTKTSDYNISKSRWKDGKGDMVKDFQLAAQSAGLKFGVYCSPWDRNNLNYGSPAYLLDYRAQLRELYTNYGELFMSWHDGANGGDGYYRGKKETRRVDASSYYDWPGTWAMTRELQPSAVIFSDIGYDVRWVGNEAGQSSGTSWSTIDFKGLGEKVPMPGVVDISNLGTGTRGGKLWVPFEADVPLRKGWFYHPEEDGRVKSVRQLYDLYCNSVGRGGCLDVGLAPTPEGLLHKNDVDTLAKFGRYLKSVFAYNLTTGASVRLSDIRGGDMRRFGAKNLTDGDRYSYWATADEVHQARVELRFKKPVRFSLIRLRENIKLGQRIDSIVVETLKSGSWVPMATATSIGACRLIRLNNSVSVYNLRLRVYARASIALSELGLFLEPEYQEIN